MKTKIFTNFIGEIDTVTIVKIKKRIINYFTIFLVLLLLLISGVASSANLSTQNEIDNSNNKEIGLNENYTENVETDKVNIISESGNKDIIAAKSVEKQGENLYNKINSKFIAGIIAAIIILFIVIRTKGNKEQNFNSIIVAFIVVVIIMILLDLFIGSPTDNNSARYMISAIIQSEAAILAIVLSLSLVAAQMTASSYSTRTIDIFGNNIWLWGLLCLYIIAMSTSLYLLKIIGDSSSVQLTGWYLPFDKSVQLNSALTLSFTLGILCFGFLIPYTYNVIKLLNPSTIIDKLTGNITKESILNSFEGRNDDPMQPIMDIINSSIEKHDYGTTRYGLNNIEVCMCNLLNGDITNSDAKKIVENVCKHIGRTLKFTDVRNYGDLAIEAINTIVAIGKTSSEKKLKGASFSVAVTLEKLGIAYAKREFTEAAYDITGALGSIGTTAANNHLGKTANRAALAIGKVGTISTGNPSRGATKGVVGALLEVGRSSVENTLPDAVRQVSIALGKFGTAAAEKANSDNKLESEVNKSINALEKLGSVLLYI